MSFTTLKQNALDSNAGATIEALTNVNSRSGTSIREDLLRSHEAFQTKSVERQSAADRATAATAELKSSTRALRDSISMAALYGRIIGAEQLAALTLGDDIEHDLLSADLTYDLLTRLSTPIAQELALHMVAVGARVRKARTAAFETKPPLARLNTEWNSAAKLLASLTDHGRAMVKGNGLKLPQKQLFRERRNTQKPNAPASSPAAKSGKTQTPATVTPPASTLTTAPTLVPPSNDPAQKPTGEKSPPVSSSNTAVA